PDEEDARKARRVVRVFTGKAQRLRLECRGDEGGHLPAGGGSAPGDIEGIGCELRRGRQPPHALVTDGVVDQAAPPITLRRPRLQLVAQLRLLVTGAV